MLDNNESSGEEEVRSGGEDINENFKSLKSLGEFKLISLDTNSLF